MPDLTLTYDVPEPGDWRWTAGENELVDYVVSSLREGQEYDAGNTLLFLIDKQRLTSEGMTRISDELLGRSLGFNSKIGRIIYPKVCRVCADWHSGRGDLGKAQRFQDRVAAATRGVTPAGYEPQHAEQESAH